MDELYMYDVLRADRCISVNSLEARVPFGDLDFVKYVMSIRPELKMNTYDMGKYLLRKAFADDHILPDDILWRQKAAFSDAVGHSMVDDLKAYAESLYSDEAFGRGCEKYTFAKPFTKESLLYRDIFEKYYPGQADMVKDFWMPNKAWKGCDVKTPPPVSCPTTAQAANKRLPADSPKNAPAFQRRRFYDRVCKPGSVIDSHLSRAHRCRCAPATFSEAAGQALPPLRCCSG